MEQDFEKLKILSGAECSINGTSLVTLLVPANCKL